VIIGATQKKDLSAKIALTREYLSAKITLSYRLEVYAMTTQS
jgi:hypothetical protein